MQSLVSHNPCLGRRAVQPRCAARRAVQSGKPVTAGTTYHTRLTRQKRRSAGSAGNIELFGIAWTGLSAAGTLACMLPEATARLFFSWWWQVQHCCCLRCCPASCTNAASFRFTPAACAGPCNASVRSLRDVQGCRSKQQQQ
jgi:hypothetical protein